MIKYQQATNTHAPIMRTSASGTSSILASRLSTCVIFQIRCSEPINEKGADTTTFSDGSLLLMLLFYLTETDTSQNNHDTKYATIFKKLMPHAFCSLTLIFLVTFGKLSIFMVRKLLLCTFLLR